MPENGVGDLQHALDFGDLGLLEVEFLDDVIALSLLFDPIGQTTLAPWGDLAHLAAISLNQMADLLDLLLDGLIVKLRLDDVHQFVRRQSTTSFPLGFAP